MGLEPTTNGTTIHYSNLLSYIHHLLVRKDNTYFEKTATTILKYLNYLSA